MKTQYDVVWLWSGGRENGYWSAARPAASTRQAVDKLVDEIERAGRVAVRGKRSIGAPDGCPSEDRFEAIGMGKKARFLSRSTA